MTRIGKIENLLNKYINEFTFNLNGGNCERDTIGRITILARHIKGKQLSYKELMQ